MAWAVSARRILRSSSSNVIYNREVLPVVDRVDFVIAAAGGVLQEFDAATVLQQANAVFAQAAQTARTPAAGHFASISVGVEYIDGQTVRG
jgi:hypothetical protein